MSSTIGAFQLHTDGKIELWKSQDASDASDGGDTSRCVQVSIETGAAIRKSCTGPLVTMLTRSVDGSRYSGGSTGYPYMGDPVFRKYDNTGALLWERILQSKAGDGLNSVAATPDGGVVGAGYAIVGERVEMHNWDGLLIKLDTAGNQVWRRQFGGTRRDEFSAVAVLPDGSIIVSGYTGSQGAHDWWPWLLRLNSSGELEGSSQSDLKSVQR
jgi:hypothetical protein